MFEQVKLAYKFSDLEPHIDAKTMEVHYTGHHATYTKALNDLVSKIPSLQGKSIEDILMNINDVPEEHRKGIINNGGGFLNHNIYFESLSPDGGKEPEGILKDKIYEDFGSFHNLCENLKNAAIGQFGSGYACLVYNRDEKRMIVKQIANQDVPNDELLLLIDVWEHAYYLKYQNKRADHIAAIFNVIDWDIVEKRYDKWYN